MSNTSSVTEPSQPTMYYCWGELGDFDDLDDIPVMTSAGVAWRNPGDGFTAGIPDASEHFVDSGGFQSTKYWGMDYPYSWKEYMDWAEHEVGADYVALPDHACEPELHESDVSERVFWTIMDHAEAMDVYLDHGYSFQPVPVVQGWYPKDYRTCLRHMRQHGLVTDYMAIGTVCKRDSVDDICAVLSECERAAPDTEWHMFGMTKHAWNDLRLRGRFRSADTKAWAQYADDKEHKRTLLSDYKEDIDTIREGVAANGSVSDYGN